MLAFENKPCEEIICSSKIDQDDDLSEEYLLNLENQLLDLQETKINDISNLK